MVTTPYCPLPNTVIMRCSGSVGREDVPYETRDDMKKAATGMIEKEGGILPDDNVRIYVPMDLNADIIMWQLYSLFGSLGHPSESKSPVNRKLIDWLMDHQEIRDQLWKKMLDEEQN
mgnify:CR=1 FL=1